MQTQESQSFPKATSFGATLVRSKIMGPNPLKLCKELLRDVHIPCGVRVCDLGSGTGITSALLAANTGLTPTLSICGATPSKTVRSSIRSVSRATRFTLLRQTPRRGCRLSTTILMRS